MRYRAELQAPEPAGADQAMITGTAAYSVLVGVLLLVFGWRVVKPWIAVIGLVLTGSGASYLLARAFGLA